MKHEDEDKEISSAEMTATWRSQEPEVSFDSVSGRMATPAGADKATRYQHEQYPFAARHFSLRAGYFYRQALQLLDEGDYDAIISIGSGFSLLTYTIAMEYQCKYPGKPLYIFDSDLEKIIVARVKKQSELELDTPAAVTFEQAAIDVEKAFKSGMEVDQLFNPSVKKPIFILEGVSYFLTPDCLQWLFLGIQRAYMGSAVIWDYWPDDLVKRSAFFNTVLTYFKKSLPEEVNALISTGLFSTLVSGYQAEESELVELEASMIAGSSEHVLTDENTHIPAKLCTLRANSDQ